MDMSFLFGPDMVSGVTAAVSVASAVATVLPMPKRNGVYKTIYSILQWVGMNFGKAKNAQDQKPFTFSDR